MHRNRPILYIALIIKSKTLLILKSKKRLSLQFVPVKFLYLEQKPIVTELTYLVKWTYYKI